MPNEDNQFNQINKVVESRNMPNKLSSEDKL